MEPHERSRPVSRFEASGLLLCIRNAAQAGHALVRNEFGAIHRGNVQGTLLQRYLLKELLARAQDFGWEVRVRDFYGRDADPESRLPNFGLVCFPNGASIVFTNSTYRGVPRSWLMRTGLTKWQGSDQAQLFEVPPDDDVIGWAIPSDVETVYFLRFVVDRSVPERNVVYGFDLVELEAGGLEVRRFVIRDLSAFAGDTVIAPEPAPTPRRDIDSDAFRAGPIEDDMGEEPDVTWRDDAPDTDDSI